MDVDYSSRGDPIYRVNGDGRQFYTWLRERQGAAVSQTEAAVRGLVEGDRFAAAHPNATHHLNEAFTILWSDRTGDTALSDFGGHLRNALMDVTADVVGTENGGKTEYPAAALTDWLEKQAGMHDRERRTIEALVEYVGKVMSLDHRATHVRDEADKGEPANASTGPWSAARPPPLRR